MTAQLRTAQLQTDGERWLAAARCGGLPEPALPRWQPLRVGIVNLWEYDNAEFWFAGGRLVLRGGNGAGKTKVLELTTLMLLRGEISASVLDPFGSQHRTMRFNLLPTGEGDDPRPAADSGLGYAWAEFGRRDEHGQPHYLTCGLGASARRGTGTSGVSTWQLLTQLRPGQGFQLAPEGRPVDAKELRKIDGVEVLDNATRYRARLARELFGLAPEAYDNLTDLLKQLRKPKLGERLNPASLAETLREALPPLATNEINQLAEGWDRLKLLREAVEETKAAALQVAQFVRTGWLPWARVVVRRRADELSSATTELDKTTEERRLAQDALEDANITVARLRGELAEAKIRHGDLNTELRELLESQAFKDAASAAQRVSSLKTQTASLAGQLSAAEARVSRQRGALAEATTAVGAARDKTDIARRDAAKRTTAVESLAEPAGLAASVRRHLASGELPALHADLDLRTERFERLRELRREFARAEEKAERSAQTVRERTDDAEAAAEEETAALTAVEDAVEGLRQRIREWARAAPVARCTGEQVESWCDLVAELTVLEPGDTRAASPAAAIAAHLDTVRETLRGERERVRGERAPLAEERRQLTVRLREVQEQAERPPPPPALWRRRERPGPDLALGAPLWSCVRPVDGLDGDRLDLLEAALAAAGLLDAWLSPDGRLSTMTDTDGAEPVDVQLHHPHRTDQAHTLAAVLEPTEAGGVPPAVIRAALLGIGWHPSRPATERGQAWLAADGTWRVGPLTGRAEAIQPASYLGATAREAARQREIQRLETRLAELAALITGLERRIGELDADLSTLREAGRRVPAERPVTDAVTTLRVRTEHLRNCRRRLALALEAHQDNESVRDAAWATFADYAGQHGFPLHELEELAAALQTYRVALVSLASALTLLWAEQQALAGAEKALSAQQTLLAETQHEAAGLTTELRQATIKLKAAQDALDSDHQDQLRRKDLLDGSITRLGAEIERLTTSSTAAQVQAGKASDTLETHEKRRQDAEAGRDAALAAWWETLDSGLAQALGLAEPDRRNVTTARESTRAMRRELTVSASPGEQDRLWRRCNQKLEELRRELLPNRDARVIDDAETGTIPRVVVLADSATGWQEPAQASDALAATVRQQEATFDEEQQRVLTNLLGSTFIEHLKDRLDYTQRTFSGINKQLAAHPTRHGHTVRLLCEADPADPDAGAVVTALSQGYQQLSAPRQEQVRSFLARKIDAARSDATAEGTADWKEALAAALDYRGWLRISLQYRPGTNWVAFDAAKHGAKSGGEKVVLLSQPLFAAAVVAFNAAGDTAPRWVWLDEAMTGVDAEVKASFMGLTVDFDLDVMLTAHDEWCKYPTVPAVAVYDLARQRHVPGVDAMPYLWCGGEWHEVGPASTPQAALNGHLREGLFAELDTT